MLLLYALLLSVLNNFLGIKLILQREKHGHEPPALRLGAAVRKALIIHERYGGPLDFKYYIVYALYSKKEFVSHACLV